MDGNFPIITQERDLLNPAKYRACFLRGPRHDERQRKIHFIRFLMNSAVRMLLKDAVRMSLEGTYCNSKIFFSVEIRKLMSYETRMDYVEVYLPDCIVLCCILLC